MKIQFDKNQGYQLEAIDAVLRSFEGQALAARDFEITSFELNPIAYADGTNAMVKTAIGNQLSITHEQILENIQTVQEGFDLTPSSQLELIKVNDSPVQFPNLSIEMETGTGKTYVYLRTIYELNRTYGFSKFVIVVPSVAIREGVLKNLQMTQAHFQEIYNTPTQFSVYDSKKLNVLNNFARSNAVQILVINIDAFAGDGRVITEVREQGIAPIEFIQATNPIVIVDEPQNFESEIRRQALANLNPMCCLRYSATHKDAYNLIYKLDPVRAYDLGLVKQIEVDSVVEDHATSGAYIKIEKFKKAAKSITVQLTIHQLQANGVSKISVNAKLNDHLFDLSNELDVYRDGYKIINIDSVENYIEFANGEVVELGSAVGGLNEDIQKTMIRATIERHLNKEKRLREQGIKVLSVFFIDKVSNYRNYDEAGNPTQGKFAVWFEESLTELLKSPRFRDLYAGTELPQLHDGYFSQDKNKRFKDSKEKSTKDDNSAFELIMRKKEELLDINTPLRFIFSHSALREGWDNPNVFQICTLNETTSTVKKRQEIGRGLRLCVNQDGERVHGRDVNRLTVVANESYDAFAKALQNEIEEDTGVNFSGRVKDAREKKEIRIKDKWLEDGLFQDLWERIKHKTMYRVEYKAEDLIQLATHEVTEMPKIVQPQIVRTLVDIEIDNTGVSTTVRTGTSKTVENQRYPIPDFVGYIQSKTELTRDTIISIINGSGRLTDVLINPQMFMEQVAKAINYAFDQIKISHIKYEKIANQFYEMQMFEVGEIERYLDNLVPVTQQAKTLYDHIEIDSPTERNFAQACEKRDDILFYVKLPSKFKIKTPLGMYNPDWALIKRENEDTSKLYFVAETKGAAALQDKATLRLKEIGKIECGKKHFELFKDEMTFKVVDKLEQI